MNQFVTLSRLCLALAFVANVAQADSCSLPSSVLMDSVVRVSDTDGVAASGVVVADNLLLTAAHAVHEGATLRFAPDGEAKRPASVIALDRTNDLALLSADTTGLVPIALAARSLHTGEAVWAAGYPRNTALHVSTGSFSKPRGDRLELKAWIDSGHSGGAVFHCERGVHRLAGIVHGYIARRTGEQYVNTGRSVSISIASVTAFLNRSNAMLKVH